MALNNPTGYQHYVVTIHGIRTHGDWQARLKTILADAAPSINVYTYVFGYFSAFAFIFPPYRWFMVRRFRRELIRLCEEHSAARIDVVAHSFGTHLIGWALKAIPTANRPKIHTIILAGSVLKHNFPWSELIAEGTVRRVVNDCGINDFVLVLNRLAVFFTGAAGRFGFAGMTSHSFQNRFFQGGHSHYFRKDSTAYDGFMRQYWVPLLVQESPIQERDERSPPTFFDGIWLTLLNNAEPIKLLLLLSISILLVSSLYGLYTSERDQRLLAVETKKELFLTVRWLVQEMVPAQVDIEGKPLEAWNPQTIGMLRELITRLDKSKVSDSIFITAYEGKFCRDKIRME